MSALSSPVTESKPQGLKKKYALKTPGPKPRPSPVQNANARGQEPWSGFSDADLLNMAHSITRYIHFLDPSVVAAVVQDNQTHGAAWKRALERAGVKPDRYLWEGSACCYPGIRRFEGAVEKEAYTKKRVEQRFPNALALDFNDYPKLIWEHLVAEIPPHFSLMHLISYRDAPPSSGHSAYLPVKGVHGLFTSATNMVYVPNALVTIVSVNPPLRALLIRRQQRLYGGLCALVPAGVSLPPIPDAKGWDYESFEWPPCSAGPDIQAFLHSRNQKMAALLGL